jgi:hypothetical protein
VLLLLLVLAAVVAFVWLISTIVAWHCEVDKGSCLHCATFDSLSSSSSPHISSL